MSSEDLENEHVVRVRRERDLVLLHHHHVSNEPPPNSQLVDQTTT
jgi:predicted SnoaL-like aldol condensation-catalyzing enzyme